MEIIITFQVLLNYKALVQTKCVQTRENIGFK